MSLNAKRYTISHPVSQQLASPAHQQTDFWLHFPIYFVQPQSPSGKHIIEQLLSE